MADDSAIPQTGWTKIRVHHQYQHRFQHNWIVTIVLISRHFNHLNSEDHVMVVFQQPQVDRVNLDSAYYLSLEEFRQEFFEMQPDLPPSKMPTPPPTPRKWGLPAQH
ncbi:hypothetical protein ACQ4M3_07440 [Leptolyngbya sp. AN03gr2]|uniref:hypothetical protein n=1 Tax=unclassified Leptolyngbya TaxID=2650499 RepID=UPI003D320508